jgi:hypothetical protein
MRKIILNKWKAKLPDGTEVEENIVSALNALIALKNPEKVPRGLDKFRLYSKLVKAFDTAEVSGILELGEDEYKFLKESIENDIPSVWGTNQDISSAIESFLDAKFE